MKLAIVTGANKGIGHGIVELLLKALPSTEWDVYLTARDLTRGQEAIKEFSKLGLHPKFHQLDINDKDSRAKLLQFVKDSYPNGINILVNNAGIAFKNDSTAPFGEQASVTLATNYFATMDMCQEFLPLMGKNSRLVNISSMTSLFALRKLSDKLYQKFISPMQFDELNELMRQFIRHAESGDHLEAGWPDSAYGTSKLGVTKGTMILADMHRNDPRHILINCCCPGYVDTDMTSGKGTKTILEGADTPVYLATLPETVTDLSGQYVSDRKVQPWQR